MGNTKSRTELPAPLSELENLLGPLETRQGSQGQLPVPPRHVVPVGGRYMHGNSHALGRAHNAPRATNHVGRARITCIRDMEAAVHKGHGGSLGHPQQRQGAGSSGTQESDTHGHLSVQTGLLSGTGRQGLLMPVLGHSGAGFTFVLYLRNHCRSQRFSPTFYS